MSEPVQIESTDGLKLEAELSSPDDPRAALVLCHPHPKMGGTMNAPLLVALCDAFVSDGWAVLRFNFRGIGNSEGEAREGLDEVADAEGAVEALRSRVSDVPLAIAGWSFGAGVALRVSSRVDVAACVAIAPSVKGRSGVTVGLPPPDELALDVPSLFVCGENDEVTPPDECRAYTEGVEGATFKEAPAANHLFWGKYESLAGIVLAWLKNKVLGETEKS